jgi:hypothetical protein
MIEKVENINEYVNRISSFQKHFENKKIRVYYRGESRDYKKEKCLPAVIRKGMTDNYVNTVFKHHPEEFIDLGILDSLAKIQHFSGQTNFLI